MNPRGIALALLVLAGFGQAQVVPAPKRLSSAEWPDTNDLAHQGLQRLRCEEPAFEPQVGVLLESLQDLGVSDAELVDEDASITFRKADLETGESYRIQSTPGGLEVLASEPAGAAHAVTTLLQLVRVADGRAVWPRLTISDGPDHPYRSFMVDMGRNPHGPETLRRVVDMLAFYKVNLLHLHLGDDQLFSWPSRAFPKLLSDRAGWTWKDFEDLEAYSQARGVTLLPELDVPGHSTLLRREYPEVFGEQPTDLASSPEAQAGVETLLGEIMSVFRASPYVHVGGDEAYGVPEDVQRDFINRLDDFISSKGRRTVVWEGPRLGQGENKVHEGVLQLNWRTVNVPAQEMLDAGYEVVNAAWDPLYIVDHYPRTMFTAVDVERCYRWDPRRFAHVNHDIRTFAQPHVTESAAGILGFCMPWWEGREENLVPLCLPRLAAVASAAWNRAGENDFADFQARQARALLRLEQLSGLRLPELPIATAESQAGNHAFLATVRPSSGASQPHFGPQRLTNGITERFDHFLGYPTKPRPLEIVLELRRPASVGRVTVHEAAVGESHELYEVSVSRDGVTFDRVGSTERGSRGETDHVDHEFPAREILYIKITTQGCHGLTFPSFSRLTEVLAFER